MKRPLLQMDPQVAWQRYEPTAKEPWNPSRIVRLHRRAGFRISGADLNRDLADGHEASIQRVLHGHSHGPDGRDAQEFASVVQLLTDTCERQPSITRLTHLWLYRMLLTPFPLAEKMTLIWHGHYATNNDKMYGAESMMWQHFTLRKHWRANARTLHLQMLRDPALLRWLDGLGSKKERPNENLAREFFELFALGEGNYTEGDVREAARTLTGWYYPKGSEQRVQFVEEYHDGGEKTVFGLTGRWKSEDLVRITCGQASAASHLAWRLWRVFISDTHDPHPDLLAALAKHMRRADDIDISAGIEVLLRSRLFYSDVCRGKRIASPAEFVIGALRACELSPKDVNLSDVVAHMARMGQRLFYPPGVAGWTGGLDWLHEPSLLARANFAAWLSRLETNQSRSLDQLTTLMTGSPISARRREELLAQSSRNRLRDVLSLPEAQVI